MTIIVNEQTGERMELQNGQWVPLQPPPIPERGPTGLGDIFTGASRQTRATEELPELGFGGILSTEPTMDVLRTAPGLLLAGPQEREQILSQFPNIGIVEDERGNKIAVNKQTGAQVVINKPGISGTDIQQLIATTAAFAPAATFAGAGRTALGGGGVGALDTLKRFVMSRLARGAAGAGATQAAIEQAQEVAGGEFAPGEVGTAAALGGGVELLGPLAKRIFTPKARRIVGEELSKVFPDVPSVQRELLELGPEARLIDISAPTRGLGVGAAVKSPTSRQKLADFLSKRATGASTRVKTFMRKKFGAQGDDFTDFLENTVTRRAEEAGPLYEAARAQQIPADSVNNLIRFADDIVQSEKAAGHPQVKTAINKLRKSLMREVDGDVIPKTSVDGIDVARETFGANIWEMRRSGRIGSKLYNELVKVRDKFDEILPEEYIQANRIFADESKVIDAYKLGEKFFTATDDDLSQLTRTMSLAERDGLMAGLAKAVSRKVGTKVPTGKIPRALETEAFREKLQIILPDEQLVDDFINGIQSEGVFSATRQAIEGGSDTALKQMAERRLTAAVGERRIFSLEGVKETLTRRRGIGEKTADEISSLLIENLNDKQIEAILNANLPPKALPAAVRAMVQAEGE